MKNIRLLLFAVLSAMIGILNAQPLTTGVSKELADYRKSTLSNIIYNLTFNIPSGQKSQVRGKAVISFELLEKQDVVLDFTGGFNGLCTINRKKNRQVRYQDEHIVLPKALLRRGFNQVELDFVSQDKALNRNKDYMYTLFVPDQARTVFPCFDQPDLRAKFITHLNTPSGWKTMTTDGTNPIPTYLYSFVAGNFNERTAQRNGMPMRVLYRETDPQKVAQIDQILDEAGHAVKWMEGYTGIKCPFAEYGMVIIPGYQFGGMEHPGAIQLNARRLFLSDNPSQDEILSRAELIAHETAHLWFGDMVSLKWFEDVWAKEVFASFMASKITRRQFTKIDHDLNFIKTYQKNAIAIDRTEGTHPIAQPLDNLNHASMLYDNIIYDKAPVMMRMMEQLMGANVLQNGLSKYLHKYYFKNASWEDLIDILDKENPEAGIRQFSNVWVKEKGMPNIHVAYRDGQLVVTQTDPYGRGICWPQKFTIQIIYDFSPSRTILVDMKQPTMTYKLKGTPSCIIPNYDGQGYGNFTLDGEYMQKLPLRLITTRKDLNRYALLLTIHENYLRGKVTPSYFGEIYRMMIKEKNPLIMSTAIDHMFKIASDLRPEQRTTLELCMTDLLKENKSRECRQLIVRKLASNATSPEVLNQINAIWQTQNDPLFNDHDYMEMAYRLAQMNPNSWHSIIATQRNRLKADDLRKEFDYVSRACNPDETARIELFNQILKPENRIQEPWALKVVSLLSADIYEPMNNSLIASSLSSLPYIQQTSDIFFSGHWLKALLANHHGVGAQRALTNFLDSNPAYPQHLRDKVLEAGWYLMKQRPYVDRAKRQVIPPSEIKKSRPTTNRR